MVKKLLMINLRAMYVSMFMRGKKRADAKRSVLVKIGVAALAVYVIAAFAMLIVMLFGELLVPFFELGIGWMYFSLNGLIVMGLCIITCIFMAQAQIFNAKDNELLLAMPIKPSSILLARILTLLVIEYIFEALIAIPALALWISGGYATFGGVILAVIGYLLLPLFALALACLLAWILTLLTARLRRKNIVTLLISLVFLGAYFWVFSNLQRHIDTLLSQGAEIAETFRRFLPPLFYFGRAISDAGFTDLLIFVVFAVVPFAVMIALLSRSFIKVATTKRGARKIEYRAGAMKASGHILAINKKELRHYWSNPGIVLNTSLGGIFAIIVGGYLLFARESAGALIDQLSVLIPGVGSTAVLVAAVLAITASMNLLPAAQISLEGKRLWILRSMPVKSRDVLLGKLMMSFEISALPTFLGSVLCIIAMFSGDLSGALIIILLPLVFIILTCSGGLIANLHMPKFDWINELQPVKQSLPTILVMFCTAALVITIAAIYIFALSSFLSLVSFAWLLIFVLAVVDFLLIYWLVTYGAKKFDALDS